jgi:hypothetical protein
MFLKGVVTVLVGMEDVVFPGPVLIVSVAGDDLPGNAGESFLQLFKSVAAVANSNRNLLKREFRVLVCIIGSIFCFQL